MLENPFSPSYSDAPDRELVEASLAGNQKALESLILRHRPFLYNLVWRMVLSPADAEDITQDILIRVMTNLSSFEFRSQFRTWLYRLAVNHILNLKKRQLEQVITTFEDYFQGLSQMPDSELSPAEQIELEETVREVSLSCTAGMLLCLSREQRLVLVLGDIFSVDHQLGAELLDITPANFRQRLSRARKDLYNWMNNKCGLVNRSNPCHCPKKTKAFIAQGYVDPGSLRFNANYEKKLSEVATLDYSSKCETIEEMHQKLFRETPFKNSPKGKTVLKEIFNHPVIKEIYRF